MAISFDKALGIHEQALQARVRRAELLANNLANADTPGFKARDIDFRAMMARAQDEMSALSLSRTHERHLEGGSCNSSDELLYRIPLQPSVDGNTVDAQQEQSRFMRNAMDFQASFQFLSRKFSGLTRALKGE